MKFGEHILKFGMSPVKKFITRKERKNV